MTKKIIKNLRKKIINHINENVQIVLIIDKINTTLSLRNRKRRTV